MAITAIIHFVGEDAIVGDLEALPDTTQQYVIVRNVRRKDGKIVPYVERDAKAFLFPLARITFIELMGDVAEVTAGTNGLGPAKGTTIFGFFREDEN
ncbi:MAG: hypothetical protein M3P94_02785 [Chloroflexota bacterium]|nr:hypothetical protein [Chloroflexia bacterium]MDQ3167558.1 hypothetical protein [Chloroflexota bacterium]MDQ3512826.1 hypothetical protein [Chloroflexota bacterium]